jgi:hypothetical protein
VTVAKRKGQAELPPHRIETRRVSDLTPAAYNPRKISPQAMAGLTASVERFGAVQPIIVNERTGHIVGGHQRLKALQQLGQTETTVVVVDLSEPDERALNVTLNNPHIAGEFSDGLGALLDTISGESPGLFSDLRLDALLPEAEAEPEKKDGDAASESLAERFGVPPFSVLDARQGYWQDRKRAWLALGIKSELGRGGGEKLTMSDMIQREKPSADQAAKRSRAGASGQP